MPPSSVENSLAGLIELCPDLTDELLNAVDQPLKVQKDTKAGREFILCDYIRDGDIATGRVNIIFVCYGGLSYIYGGLIEDHCGVSTRYVCG